MTQEEKEEFNEFLEWKKQSRRSHSGSDSTSRSPRSGTNLSCERQLVPADSEAMDDVATKLERQLNLKGDQVLNPTRYMKHLKALYATNQYKEARLVLNHCEGEVRARKERITTSPDVKSDKLFKKTLIWKAARAARI